MTARVRQKVIVMRTWCYMLSVMYLKVREVRPLLYQAMVYDINMLKEFKQFLLRGWWSKRENRANLDYFHCYVDNIVNGYTIVYVLTKDAIWLKNQVFSIK